MRKIIFNDATTDILKLNKSWFEESESDINKNIKVLDSFLNDEENKTYQNIANSFINQSKIMDIHKIDFNLKNLINNDNDSIKIYCNNNEFYRSGSSTN